MASHHGAEYLISDITLFAAIADAQLNEDCLACNIKDGINEIAGSPR